MIKKECLANGLEIIFEDQSNRYFGDYHRICVIVTIRCPIVLLEDQELKAKATELYGDHLDVVKHFKRMGVPTAEVDNVRNALINDFLKNATSYLSRPDYPQMLVNAELTKRRTTRFYG